MAKKTAVKDTTKATKAGKKDLGHAQHSRRADNIGIMDKVSRPIKVVFLGAGSAFFQSLFIDVMNIPGADRGEMAIVDIDVARLGLAEKLGRKILAQMGKNWTLTATTDRRKVLRGADYIINCIEVSGVQAVKHDNNIPLKYGVDQCIGDTLGPGGLFKALRTVPVFLKVLRDVEELCPNAWVLNYTNPMSIMTLAAVRASKAKVVGLCHSVQGTTHELANIVDMPYQDIVWQCAGINHLAWVTQFRDRKGRDLYPLIFDRAQNDKEVYERSPIRFDVMLHFGHFITESSGHLSEYLPYYRKRKDLIKKYCRERYKGESSFYSRNWPTWRKNCDQKRRDLIAGKDPISTDRTWEYASFIIQAMETNAPFVIHGNVANAGLITNLPQDGVVEVACVVDSRGITPTRYGALPPQCAALCDWNMRMIDLAAQACIEKSRDLAAQALMLDPLTAACCCPAEIKKMTYELFKAEKDLLPGF